MGFVKAEDFLTACQWGGLGYREAYMRDAM